MRPLTPNYTYLPMQDGTRTRVDLSTATVQQMRRGSIIQSWVTLVDLQLRTNLLSQARKFL